MENLDRLVNALIKEPTERQWLEFKHNNDDPSMIGQNICALANGAALCEKDRAYMLWGIDDSTHEIIGTNVDLQNQKVGNEELNNWLRQRLSRNADFEFHLVDMNGKSVVVLIIYKATNQPVMFEKTEYIRVGSYTKKLNDYPAIKTQLWDRIRGTRFEEQIALQDLELSEALRLLDYTIYFDMLGIPQPSNEEGVLHYLLEDCILKRQDDSLFGITNLGAILFAKRLSDFPRISRKALRIVQYKEKSRLDMLKEEIINKGYVVGFEGVVKYIEALIPTQELIHEALRERKTAFPILAIREAVANALIHQDFSVTGTGPVVEIFDTRIEITNAGRPLVDVKRIVDNPPKSRNEKLAELMRRLKICEELGTGWDKMVISCEIMQLPSPQIVLYDESTRVTLFSEKNFSNISSADKLWACYLHSCIKYVQGEQLTNSSLRKRFGLQESSAGTISRLIKEAVKSNLIKPLDPTTANRYMKYIPAWA